MESDTWSAVSGSVVVMRGYAAPFFARGRSETPLASWDHSCEAASVSGPGPAHDHSLVVSRFVEACSADDRIVAAFLCGSCARGEADAYSDLDLAVITSDEALENVMAERAAFVRQLGEPMFMEDFGHDRIAFFILADGTECELVFRREARSRCSTWAVRHPRRQARHP